MAQPVQARGFWTFDDLADLEDDLRHEVVDGVLLTMSQPTSRHDRIGRRLQRQIDPQLPPGWDTMVATGVRMGTDGRSPDLMVIREDALVRSSRQVGWEPPDVALVVEVVSPGSRKTDRFFKPIEYAMAGIGVYLRLEIDPTLLLVVHELDGDRYRQVATYEGIAELTAPFPLRLDVTALD